MEDKLNFLKKLADSDGGRRAVVLLGLIGVALIFLSSFFSGEKKVVPVTAASSASSAVQTDDEAYAHRMEQELTVMIGHIRGAGTPQVMVTLEAGSEEVYAQQEKHATQQDSASGGGQNADSTETGCIIVKDADGSEHTVPVTRRQPRVQGVVVACPGAQQPAVQQAVMDAVTAAAGVSSVRVCVVPST